MDGGVCAGATAVESGVATRAAWNREPLTGHPHHNWCLAGAPGQIKTALAEGQGRLESNTLLGTAAPLGDKTTPRPGIGTEYRTLAVLEGRPTDHGRPIVEQPLDRR